MRHALVFTALVVAALRVPEVAPPGLELGLLVAAIALVGVPHGALDVAYAARLFELRSPARWLTFVFGYLGLAGIVILLWWAIPLLTLVGFLLVSAYHFGGDLAPGTGALLRVFHGATPLVLPAVFHSAELVPLFGALVPASSAELLVGYLGVLAPLLLVLLALGLLHLVTTAQRGARVRAALPVGIEVATTAALALLADPLIAFTVYFCGLHSIRHLARTGRLFSLSRSRMLALAGPPMVGTLLLAGFAFVAVDPESVDVGLLQVTFVGLAGLTVPHMLLVEPWLRARARDAAPA